MIALTINTKNVCKFQNIDQAKSFITMYMDQDKSNYSDIVCINDGTTKKQAVVGYSHLGNKIAYVEV